MKLNGGRQVQGVLRGFDPFMNLVMDDCLEMAPGGIQNTIGMVVSTKRRCQLLLHTISEDRHILILFINVTTPFYGLLSVGNQRKQHHHVGGP